MIEVIGHGGAGDFFPGNSLQSIEQALKIGVDRIEIDLLESKDGELVLVHDDRIAIDGKTRWFSEITTDEFRRSLPGLLTIDEAIERVGKVPLLLDVKCPGYEERVIQAIRRHSLESTVAVSTTHTRVISRIKRDVPRARYGLSSGHIATGLDRPVPRAICASAVKIVTPLPLIVAMKLCGATETMIHHRACSKLLVRAAHASGYKIYPWTVDRAEQMHRLIAWGVDGIISNRPDLVRDALAEASTL